MPAATASDPAAMLATTTLLPSPADAEVSSI
jgi:hypothetical protein